MAVLLSVLNQFDWDVAHQSFGITEQRQDGTIAEETPKQGFKLNAL